MGLTRSQHIKDREKYAKELDDRIKGIQAGLVVVDKEINNLTTNYEVMASDLENLRQNGVIASVSQFKKNKEDITKTINRLNLLIGDRIKIYKALKLLNSLVEDNNKEYALLIQHSENVVISGRFGDNKDG